MLVVVSEVPHKYVLPPEAIRVALLPAQTELIPPIIISGREFTLTVISSVFVHPFASVPVTV